MIALIVVLSLGVPALVAGVGLLAFYMRRRRNETKADDRPDEKENPTGSNEEPHGYWIKAELPADERPTHMAEVLGSGNHDYIKQEPADVKVEPYSKDKVCEHQGVDSSPMYELPG